jgi:hypothetical protein
MKLASNCPSTPARSIRFPSAWFLAIPADFPNESKLEVLQSKRNPDRLINLLDKVRVKAADGLVKPRCVFNSQLLTKRNRGCIEP